MPVTAPVISFDAGGVLVFPNWVRVSAALATCGIAIAPDALAVADAHAKLAMDQPREVSTTDNAGHGKAYLAELMKAAGVADAPRLAAGLEAVRHENRRRSLWESVGAGVAEALSALRARAVRMIVVSNSDGRLGDLLRDAGLAGFFELLVDSADAGVEKPDPRIFAHAMAAIGASPHDLVHVGDFYEIDVVGARASGIAPILLDPCDLHGFRDCTRIRSLAEL